MSITTRAELLTAIANWTQKSDLANRDVEFVALAEAKFNRGFSDVAPFWPRQMEAATSVSAASTITLPTDFIELRTIKITNAPVTKLQVATGDWFDSEYTSTTTARPQWFGIEQNKLRLMPAPDSAYTVALTYIQSVPALTSGNTTNWLLTAHPDIYLYGCLVEAGGFMIDVATQVPLWKQAYDRAVHGLKVVDQRSRYSGGGLVVRAA